MVCIKYYLNGTIYVIQKSELLPRDINTPKKILICEGNHVINVCHEISSPATPIAGFHRSGPLPVKWFYIQDFPCDMARHGTEMAAECPLVDLLWFLRWRRMSCLKFFIVYVFFWFQNVVHPKQSHVLFIIKNKMDSCMTIR